MNSSCGWAGSRLLQRLGTEFLWFAVGDVAVLEGLSIEGIVGADFPEAVEEFFVIRAGQSGAAGAFEQSRAVLRRAAFEVGTFGLLLAPGVFRTTMGPVLFGAKDGIGVGTFGEMGGI